jgi:hypothetical protein
LRAVPGTSAPSFRDGNLAEPEHEAEGDSDDRGDATQGQPADDATERSKYDELEYRPKGARLPSGLL